MKSDFFCDVHPPLTAENARIESARCYFCYDAPCVRACPTEIDIPNFIRKISTKSYKSAAIDILNENIMGGTCARVCPVETLCQEACVRNTAEDKPVQIGLLQRFATDEYLSRGEQPFKRQTSTGKKIAIVGGGPAGLSCAHRLAMFGHDCVVFEAKEKLGGLNEYGLAPYKIMDDWAQKEVQFILSIGGIEVKHNFVLGKNLTLTDLQKSFDSVFLSIGLSDVNSLDLENEECAGVQDAVEYIAQIRQSQKLSELIVGQNIVVIGGGSTAIDIAVEMKMLGAQEVNLVYRRGFSEMKATLHEREIAQTNGVYIRTWAKPHRLVCENSRVTNVVFEKTQCDSNGVLIGLGDYFTLQADQVFKAIGQIMENPLAKILSQDLDIKNGKIVVDENYKTSLDGVYAGGDCINGGDLTVTAVQDGKKAAHAIHQFLSA